MKSLLKSLSPFSFEPEIRETVKTHADKVYAVSYALTGEELSAEQLTQDAAARVFLKGFDLETEKEWIVEAYRLYLQKWKGKVLDLKTGRFWQLAPFARSCMTLRVHFSWSPSIFDQMASTALAIFCLVSIDSSGRSLLVLSSI